MILNWGLFVHIRVFLQYLHTEDCVFLKEGAVSQEAKPESTPSEKNLLLSTLVLGGVNKMYNLSHMFLSYWERMSNPKDG